MVMVIKFLIVKIDAQIVIFATRCTENFVMRIDTIDQLQIEDNIEWLPVNHNWIITDEHHRLIDLITLPVKVDDLQHNNIDAKYIGHVNEHAYMYMKKSMLSKGAVGYIDVASEEFNFTRMVIDVDVDDIQNCPENVNISITCEDDNNNASQLHDITIQKSKRFKQPLKWNMSQHNSKDFTLNLSSTGKYNFKVKGKTDLDVTLKCYLNLQRL